LFRLGYSPIKDSKLSMMLVMVYAFV